jgi:hypothetical protein
MEKEKKNEKFDKLKNRNNKHAWKWEFRREQNRKLLMKEENEERNIRRE